MVLNRWSPHFPKAFEASAIVETDVLRGMVSSELEICPAVVFIVFIDDLGECGDVFIGNGVDFSPKVATGEDVDEEKE